MKKTALFTVWGIRVLKLSVLSFFMFPAFTSFCQKTNLDTLLNHLSLAKDDTTKIIALNKVGVYYFATTEKEKGRSYHEEALAIAQRGGFKEYTAITLYYIAYLDYAKSETATAIQGFLASKAIYDELVLPDGIVRTNRILGRIMREQEKYSLAVNYLKTAEAYLPKLNKSSGPLGRATLNEIAYYYRALQDYEICAQYLIQELEWAEADKDSISIGISLRHMGRHFLYEEKLDKALVYLRRAYDFNAKYNVTKRDMMYCSFYLADCFFMQHQLDSAEWYVQKAHNFFKKDGSKGMLGSVYDLMGRIAFEKQDTVLGFQFLEAALQNFKAINSNWYIAITLNKIGGHHLHAGHYEKAIVTLEEAMQLSIESNKFEPIIVGGQRLAKAYSKTAKYDKAIDLYELTIQYQDSLKIAQEAQKLEAFEVKFGIKEKENEIKLKEVELTFQREALQKKQLWNYVFGTMVLFALLLVYLLWRMAQQRKKTNQTLQQLDTAKSRFFANISHELRTPLTLIIAPLENALEKIKSPKAKKDLELARDHSKKLLILVNEILDLSKLESGKMQLKETSVHLEKLLRRIFFSYHSLAQLRGFILSFSYHLPKDLAVKLDIEKLEKVVNNLLSNAFKYSLSGGVITLRASEEEGNILIEVNDTGKGIHPEDLDKVFDRFYQIENENEPLQGGTGIGLAYAKEIARLYQGDLTVKSEIGEGSTFSFHFPLKKAALPGKIVESDFIVVEENLDHETAILTMSMPNGKGERPKILVVEDNPEMSKFLIETLSTQFDCTRAMDGQMALDLLQTQSFDLITSDVMMPNMDGFTLLKKIHQRERFQHTPVILLTARAMEVDKLKGFQLGVDDYLTKPFSVKELMARIRNLLNNKFLRDEYLKESSLKPEEEQPLSFEQELLKIAEAAVAENMGNPNYKVADLAQKLNYSQRQTERIIKRMTGMSPANFIREIRLQKARQLIESRQFATIAEVRFTIGIENASYFSKVFLERFGKRPSEL